MVAKKKNNKSHHDELDYLAERLQAISEEIKGIEREKGIIEQQREKVGIQIKDEIGNIENWFKSYLREVKFSDVEAAIEYLKWHFRVNRRNKKTDEEKGIEKYILNIYEKIEIEYEQRCFDLLSLKSKDQILGSRLIILNAELKKQLALYDQYEKEIEDLLEEIALEKKGEGIRLCVWDKTFAGQGEKIPTAGQEEEIPAAGQEEEISAGQEERTPAAGQRGVNEAGVGAGRGEAFMWRNPLRSTFTLFPPPAVAGMNPEPTSTTVVSQAPTLVFAS